MLQAVIVDDEKKAVKALAWEINHHFPNIEIVGKYTNPIEALESILLRTPDILFLDIEMPLLNGFDLLSKIEDINFDIIFTTAYDEYAVKAFRINAIDYLLKPILTSDLRESIDRIILKNKEEPNSSLDRFANIRKLKSSFNKISLAKQEGIEFVLPLKIIYCKAEGSYTYVVMSDRKTIVTKSLIEMEKVLTGHNFVRTHKSYLVNLNQIDKYLKVDGGYLVMSNGDKVDVSRRKKEELMKLF